MVFRRLSAPFGHVPPPPFWVISIFCRIIFALNGLIHTLFYLESMKSMLGLFQKQILLLARGREREKEATNVLVAISLASVGWSSFPRDGVFVTACSRHADVVFVSRVM